MGALNSQVARAGALHTLKTPAMPPWEPLQQLAELTPPLRGRSSTFLALIVRRTTIDGSTSKRYSRLAHSLRSAPEHVPSQLSDCTAVFK
jgi:hypothetical protein